MHKLTKVGSLSVLLQSPIHTLLTKIILVLTRFEKPFGNDKEQHKIVDRRGESSSSANVCPRLENLEYSLEPPVPLRIAQTVERLSEGEISNEVEHKEVVPGHDVD